MLKVEVCTAQYSYNGADGLDTTFATLEAVTKADGHDEPGGWLFAPPKWLVFDSKYKGLAWSEYERLYTDLLRKRYSLRAAVYEKLVLGLVDAASAAGGTARVVLRCYCASNVIHKCHRRLAADILVTVGNSITRQQGIACEFVRGAELPTKRHAEEPERLF